MASRSAMALRQAALRQGRQSCLALCVAAASLLGLTLFGLLARALANVAARQGVPFGRIPAHVALAFVANAASDELVLWIARGKLRLSLLGGMIAVQAGLWAAAVAAAAQLGVEDIAARALPMSIAISFVSRPIAILATPGRALSANLRRTKRELKASASKLISISPSMTVMLYVYLTVFTEVGPVFEVAVMGVAMPLLQALCMTLLARVVTRTEQRVRDSTDRFAPSRSSAAASSPPPAAAAVEGSAKVAPAPPPPGAEAVAGAKVDAVSEDVLSDQAGAKKDTKTALEQPTGAADTTLSLISVQIAETFYATGAFATLALAESDGTLYVSLGFMLCIEIVQVALHVKARGVVSRITNRSTAETLLGDDTSMLLWLLYQELGEKVGVLLALGLLAVDKALWGTSTAAQMVDAGTLLTRGAVMVLLELLGYVGKDLVSQRLGVLPAQAALVRVQLPPLGLLVVVLVGINSGFTVVVALTLGS